MKTIESMQGFYRDALRAKAAYDGALLQLQDAAEKCKGERDAITKRLHAEHPELVRQMEEAYKNGERIKDAMQIGKRWPYGDGKATRYSEVLRAVPVEQRSPELVECLKWWDQFADVMKQIETLYPAPEHFWWNGHTLTGPNLWKEFGIASK